VAPLLEDAPGLPDEVIKPFIILINGLASVPHGGLDVLDREESCAPPVRGMRLLFGHGCEPLRCTAGASAGAFNFEADGHWSVPALLAAGPPHALEFSA
jgi:hypothetical protein